MKIVDRLQRLYRNAITQNIWANNSEFLKTDSKLFSLHTIALTRESKSWEDTRDCQGKRRVKCRIKHRPPPGEVGGAKLNRDFNELC